MTSEERREKVGEGLKRQLHCATKRLQCHPHLVRKMRSLFDACVEEEDCVVYWPRDTDQLTLLSWEHFVQAGGQQRPDEWIHRAFLSAFQLSTTTTKKLRLSGDAQIHISRWIGGDRKEDFGDSLGGGRTFARQRITVHSHKLCCTLPPVSHCLLTEIRGGGTLQLGRSSRHDLVLVNCVIRLSSAEQFDGLQLYLVDQAEPLSMDYETLRAAGRLDLDLRRLGAPNQPCRLLTRSPLAVVFPPEEQCSVTLRSTSPTRLELHASANLEYQCWAGDESTLMQPYSFQIETDALLPIPCESTPPSSPERALRVPRGGFSASVDWYTALQRMKVGLGASQEDVPRFVLDGAPMAVVGPPGRMLVMRDRTLARYELDHSAAQLRLQLVLPEDSKSVNPLLHYVY
jgi:hypothetical protein